MRITKLIKDKSENLYGARIPTIVFLGDSVTQGCFDLYVKSDNEIETFFNKDCAYHNYFFKICNLLFPNVPINIINAGISGGTAQDGLNRLSRDVLNYNPDLAIVCFGLNDCSGDYDTYVKSLEKIFMELNENSVEVIFMTPNMMNTKISCHIKEESIKEIAQEIMAKQLDGTLEKFLEGAKKVAKENNVVICDVYNKWKMLSEAGVDTTELLANRINHPNEKMNWIFAYSLIETIMNN